MGNQTAVFTDKRFVTLVVACASFLLLFLGARIACLKGGADLSGKSLRATVQDLVHDKDAVASGPAPAQGDDTALHRQVTGIRRCIVAGTAAPPVVFPVTAAVVQQAPSRASPTTNS